MATVETTTQGRAGEALRSLCIVSRSLCVLDSSGDSRIQWDQSNPEEVAKAQLRFDELKKLGYLAYKVNKRGDKGEVIDKFDPSAERIVLHAAMVGG
jgi:hypothetical protein